MDWFAVSIVLACLFVSAFFSASETALTGASRASMLRLSKQRNSEAGFVSALFAMRERMIGAGHGVRSILVLACDKWLGALLRCATISAHNALYASCGSSSLALLTSAKDLARSPL